MLYVGDENDEDAFALKRNVVGVRIGWKESSHARYYLHDQTEIESLLEFWSATRFPETRSPAAPP